MVTVKDRVRFEFFRSGPSKIQDYKNLTPKTMKSVHCKTFTEVQKQYEYFNQQAGFSNEQHRTCSELPDHNRLIIVSSVFEIAIKLNRLAY